MIVSHGHSLRRIQSALTERHLSIILYKSSKARDRAQDILRSENTTHLILDRVTENEAKRYEATRGTLLGQSHILWIPLERWQLFLSNAPTVAQMAQGLIFSAEDIIAAAQQSPEQSIISEKGEQIYQDRCRRYEGKFDGKWVAIEVMNSKEIFIHETSKGAIAAARHKHPQCEIYLRQIGSKFLSAVRGVP